MLQDVPDELKARTDTKGESSLRGHLKAEGDEQTGSQSYVPPDPKDDKALKMALDLIRGVTHQLGLPAEPEARRELSTSASAIVLRGAAQGPPRLLLAACAIAHALGFTVNEELTIRLLAFAGMIREGLPPWRTMT